MERSPLDMPGMLPIESAARAAAVKRYGLDHTTFEGIVAFAYTVGEVQDLETRQTDRYVSDAVDSLAEYVRSIGDSRIDKGWNWS